MLSQTVFLMFPIIASTKEAFYKIMFDTTKEKVFATLHLWLFDWSCNYGKILEIIRTYRLEMILNHI